MKKAMTLVEVILALGIMAFGIALGMELLGKLTQANAQLSAAERLQARVFAAREIIEQAEYSQVQSIFNDSEIWQVSPTVLARPNTNENINASVGIALEVELLDTHNSPVFTFPMIKHIDSGL